jgi:hypothetical protein
MWQSGLAALVLAFTLHSQFAESQSLAFSRNARTFETVNSSLIQKSVAHACLSMLVSPDGLPCNPAHTPMLKKPRLGLDLLLSNGYSNLNNIRELIKGDVSEEFANSLFSDKRVLQIEANSQLNFLSPNFNARYNPISVTGFSVLRNEANPEVEISVLEENGFVFQSGYEIYKNLFVGAQVRFASRKFIKNQFRLVDLGTPEGKDLLKAKKQTATYFEPGVTWILPSRWKPRMSFLMANVGFESERFDELDVKPDPQFGLGISPPMMWGNMEFTLDYKSLTYREEAMERFRLGGLYQFGAMNLSGGIDVNGISGGIFYSIEQISAGVMYSSTRVTNEDEEFFTQTVYVQLGWKI